MELRVAQPAFRDTIQGRCLDDAAKGARRAEPFIVGHDEQNIGRALGRYDARRPPRRRLRGLLLDHPAEFRIGRRKLFSVDGGGGVRRPQLTGDLLREAGGGRERKGGGAKRYRDNMLDCVHTEVLLFYSVLSAVNSRAMIVRRRARLATLVSQARGPLFDYRLTPTLAALSAPDCCRANQS